MLYVVEIRREREHLAAVMSAIREWLDARHFQPDIFRSTITDESVTFRLEFKIETEAMACAEVFGGSVLR